MAIAKEDEPMPPPMALRSKCEEFMGPPFFDE